MLAFQPTENLVQWLPTLKTNTTVSMNVWQELSDVHNALWQGDKAKKLKPLNIGTDSEVLSLLHEDACGDFLPECHPWLKKGLVHAIANFVGAGMRFVSKTDSLLAQTDLTNQTAVNAAIDSLLVGAEFMQLLEFDVTPSFSYLIKHDRDDGLRRIYFIFDVQLTALVIVWICLTVLFFVFIHKPLMTELHDRVSRAREMLLLVPAEDIQNVKQLRRLLRSSIL
ncbi:MAG: hypothetical protein MHM6MM_002123 [Cercozoa sp. M6MM]